MTSFGPGIFESDEAVGIRDSLMHNEDGRVVFDVTPETVEQVLTVYSIPSSADAIDAIFERYDGVGIEVAGPLLALASILMDAGALASYPLVREAAIRTCEYRNVALIEEWDDLDTTEAQTRFAVEQSLLMLLRALTTLLQVTDEVDA